MSFYQESAEIVNGILLEFGQIITLSKNTSIYDPITGAVTATQTSQTGIGAIFDYGNRDIDGELIAAGDKQLLLAVDGLDIPNISDIVTVSGNQYTIMRVKNISPAGTSVMYDCNIRGV